MANLDQDYINIINKQLNTQDATRTQNAWAKAKEYVKTYMDENDPNFNNTVMQQAMAMVRTSSPSAGAQDTTSKNQSKFTNTTFKDSVFPESFENISGVDTNESKKFNKKDYVFNLIDDLVSKGLLANDIITALSSRLMMSMPDAELVYRAYTLINNSSEKKTDTVSIPSEKFTTGGVEQALITKYGPNNMKSVTSYFEDIIRALESKYSDSIEWQANSNKSKATCFFYSGNTLIKFVFSDLRKNTYLYQSIWNTHYPHDKENRILVVSVETYNDKNKGLRTTGNQALAMDMPLLKKYIQEVLKQYNDEFSQLSSFKYILIIKKTTSDELVPIVQDILEKKYTNYKQAPDIAHTLNMNYDKDYGIYYVALKNVKRPAMTEDEGNDTTSNIEQTQTSSEIMDKIPADAGRKRLQWKQDWEKNER